MLQELEDVSWMAGCLETRGDPGQAEGCQAGIIQRARLRQAVRPRNVAAEAASAFPVAGAQHGAASQHVRAPATPSR